MLSLCRVSNNLLDCLISGPSKTGEYQATPSAEPKHEPVNSEAQGVGSVPADPVELMPLNKTRE